MKKAAGKISIIIIVAAFWLAVWHLAAVSVGSELLLPTPFSVLKTNLDCYAQPVMKAYHYSIGQMNFPLFRNSVT